MPSLARRERVPELMDDPALDPAEHRRALVGLARLNRVSDSPGVLWPAIRELARGGPLRVLDVATGSGDVPRALAARAARAGLPVTVAGCDISPTAIDAARTAAPGLPYFVHDVLRDPLPAGYDVVTCSLFLHHLSDDDAVTLLRRMAAAAGRRVLVNDLARSRFNYLSVWAACRLLTRSAVVRFDGPASVRSAFTPAEAAALARRAGLTGAAVRGRFPCRFLLQWERANPA
ncbi:MAG: methyltransferase domain-containing protein [Gemmataceae bacterium]